MHPIWALRRHRAGIKRQKQERARRSDPIAIVYAVSESGRPVSNKVSVPVHTEGWHLVGVAHLVAVEDSLAVAFVIEKEDGSWKETKRAYPHHPEISGLYLREGDTIDMDVDIDVSGRLGDGEVTLGSLE